MTSRLTHAASFLFTVATCFSNAASVQASDHQLARHAHATHVQSQRLHDALARQFRHSPFSARLCEVTHDIDDLAQRLEMELQSCCTRQHAAHLVRQLDRKVCQLNSLFRTANHRARVGIDPPVGCTLAIEAQLSELAETVHCLKSQVLHYHPAVGHTDLGHARARGYSTDTFGSFGTERQRTSFFAGGNNRSHDRGSVGVQFQRGNFRIGFGG